MELTLVRTKFTDKETRGILGCGNLFLGYTIEPPTITHALTSCAYAIPEGRYEVIIKNNPIAGTPCIKIVGIDYSSCTSIRCVKPVGKKGNGIALVSSENGSGEPTTVDVTAWSEFLNFIVTEENVELIIK